MRVLGLRFRVLFCRDERESIVLTVAKVGLTEKQAAFVQHLITGAPQKEAAELAGYAHASVNASNLMKSPQVQRALHEAVQDSLRADAHVNLKVLKKIRDDEAAPARVRADIGIKLLALAGHVQPTKRDDRPEKPLSEMTQAELLEHIERNQAAIDKAEAELMAKATDVTPATKAPDSVPSKASAGDKALSYLD